MANYWAKVSAATNLQEEAMHASLRVRWNRSRFYGATDQQILQATFTCACGNATGGTQLAKLQAAAATLVPQEGRVAGGAGGDPGLFS